LELYTRHLELLLYHHFVSDLKIGIVVTDSRFQKPLASNGGWNNNFKTWRIANQFSNACAVRLPNLIYPTHENDGTVRDHII
jgi:hypothetical protein